MIGRRMVTQSGGAIKDELVVCKPGDDVDAVSGVERKLETAITEVD